MVDKGNGASGFGAFLDSEMGALRQSFEVGEQLTGVVTMIDRKSVFVDINARSEGIIDRSELLDDEGNLTVQEGDSVTAYFISDRGDELKLAMTYGAKGDKAGLWDAFQGGIPVEGRVESERKGGFQVDVSGHKGFCPYSQIDIHRQDPEAYIGEKFRFKIAEYDEWGSNLVLNRRQLLEEERAKQQEELKANLSVGDILEGKVTKLMDFGAFVDIGGIEGLVPMSHLAWGRIDDAAEVVSEGQKVKVSVLNIEWDRGRISLSLKEAQGNPWDEVATKYAAGQRVEGRITKLMPFGAFVEIEAGVEGLVHISKLGASRRISHPGEVVEEGQTVEVEIENIDLDKRRISLSMQSQYGGALSPDEDTDRPQPVGEVVPGGRITGIVQGIKHFGLFIGLPGDKTGLLHISQIDYKGGRDPEGWFRNEFPEGTEIDVVVQEINGDRISLTTAAKWDAEHSKEDLTEYMSESGGGDFGNLGDAFERLRL